MICLIFKLVYYKICTVFYDTGTKDDIPYLCAMNGIDYFNRIGGLVRQYIPHGRYLYVDHISDFVLVIYRL